MLVNYVLQIIISFVLITSEEQENHQKENQM